MSPDPGTVGGSIPASLPAVQTGSARQAARLTLVETHKEWNNVCAEFTDAEFPQSYEWGEARRFQGWKPRRFVFTDGTAPLAALQVLVKSHFGLQVVYCPRGPIWLRRGIPSIACAKSLTGVLDAVVEAYPLSVVVCDLHCDRGLLPNSDLQARGFLQVRSGMTADIGLDNDLTALRSTLHRKWRNDLKKAEQTHLVVRRYEPAKYLDELYAIADATAARKGFVIGVEYGVAKRFLDLQGSETSVILAAVKPNGTVVAAALIVVFNRMASYLIGASVPKDHPAFSRGASNLVQWEALQWAKASECTTYNLEGLDPAGNPGVTHFKQRMNGRVRLTRGMWVWTRNRLVTSVFRTILKKRFRP